MSDLTITRQAPEETIRSFGVEHYRQAYADGINLSQFLERLDPTEARDEGDRGLDAFERLLRAAEIVVNPIPSRGIQASVWEDVVNTPTTRALVPELMARFYREVSQAPMPATRAQGDTFTSEDYAVGSQLRPWAEDPVLRATKLALPIPLDLLVARTTSIKGDALRSLYMLDGFDDNYRMKRVGEGAEIPMTTLVTSEHEMRTHKFGRGLRATYEQLRRQTLDRVAFLVQRMALQSEVDKVAIALDVLINGDGNANTSATSYDLTDIDGAAVAGTLTLKGWLGWKMKFAPAYDLKVMLAQEGSIMQVLLLNVAAGNQTPMGLLPANAFGTVKPINDAYAGAVRYGITADAPSLKLVGFDPGLALERVTEVGSTISEVERFVSNQTQILTMTEVEGYGIIDPLATRILDLNA